MITAVAGKAYIHDKAVLGEIIGYLDHMSIADVTQIVTAAGVAAQFAGDASDEALVALLYTNIAGSAPSASEHAFYLDFMHDSRMTQAQFIECVAGHDVTAQVIDLVGLARHGVEYTQ